MVRMDAHAAYADTYLEASIAALRRTGAANAGGAARPRDTNGFQRALCAALSVPSASEVRPTATRPAKGSWNPSGGAPTGAKISEQVGLFDGEALCQRGRRAQPTHHRSGGTLSLPRDDSHHYPRSSLAALARQYFVYGQGRARALFAAASSSSIRPLVPFALVTGLGFLVALALFVPASSPLLIAATATYVTGVVLESLRVAFRLGTHRSTKRDPARRSSTSFGGSS